MNRISTRNSPGRNSHSHRGNFPHPAGSGQTEDTIDSDHCLRCHETALALESITRRLINLEKNLKQEAEIARLNDILSPLLPNLDSSKSSSNSNNNNHSRIQSTSGGSSTIQRADLDEFLSPFLEQSPYAPDGNTFEQIITDCQRLFPNESRQRIISKIREWFRKRREYMTHRVYNYCNKHYRMQDGKQVIDTLRTNSAMIDTIREECSIDIGNDDEARDYVIDRVESFFERRN
jgi:hypothetical protein